MEPDAYLVFVSAFFVSAFAGLASLLRSGNKLTVVSGIASFLNSGMLGLGISLLWYMKYHENLYFLVGVCLLTGLTGMSAVDLAMSILRKGVFNFDLSTTEEKKPDEK